MSLKFFSLSAYISLNTDNHDSTIFKKFNFILAQTKQ